MATQVDIAANPDQTLDYLLNFDRQKRSSTPIRRSFLQDTRHRGQPGPLREFVTNRRGVAFDLLLLLHCSAGAAPWDVALPAMAWARALNMPQTTSSETTISKNWSWLEQQHLIRSDRHQRLRRVFLLKEDGSDAAYRRPKGEDRGYFHLSFSYFTQRWHEQLAIPGKAVLLIALAQEQPFHLKTERVSWYGISPDTLQRGLDELRDAGLLKVWTKARPEPKARLGFTVDYFYRLLAPFDR